MEIPPKIIEGIKQREERLDKTYNLLLILEEEHKTSNDRKFEVLRHYVSDITDMRSRGHYNHEMEQGSLIFNRYMFCKKLYEDLQAELKKYIYNAIMELIKDETLLLQREQQSCESGNPLASGG